MSPISFQLQSPIEIEETFTHIHNYNIRTLRHTPICKVSDIRVLPNRITSSCFHDVMTVRYVIVNVLTMFTSSHLAAVVGTYVRMHACTLCFW